MLGKYAGALLAMLTPAFAVALAGTAILLAGGAPAGIVVALPLAFLAINLPAYMFVGAFPLACPAVLPVRVYQVLFTGYWIWGNYLDPRFLPTLSGTLLNASGRYPAGAFFDAYNVVGTRYNGPTYTALEATMNLLLLAACAAAALLALERYLAWQERHVQTGLRPGSRSGGTA